MQRSRDRIPVFRSDDLVEVGQQPLDLLQGLLAVGFVAIGQVALHTADAQVVRRDARTAQHLLQVPAQLARLDPVQERRHRAELEAGRAESRQVVAHPRQLAGQHPDPLAAPRHLAAQQFLDCQHVGHVRENCRVVVQPVGVRDRLVPGPALALLLEAAVQVADLHVEIDDRLTVELGHELHGAVRGRVRRPHVHDLVVGVQVAPPYPASQLASLYHG
jgi:hypothetical protein